MIKKLERTRHFNKWIEPNSIEFTFGLTLSQLARIFGVSKNLMSLIHRRERTPASKGEEVRLELLRTQNLTDPELIEKLMVQEITTFNYRKIEFLEKKIRGLSFHKERSERKLEKIEAAYFLANRQLAYMKCIQYDNIQNEKLKAKFLLVMDWCKSQKVRSLEILNPAKQFDLQLKIESFELQIQKATTELEKLKRISETIIL